MIVQNYGLYWKRDGVNWGRPGAGNSGSLDGLLVSSRTSKSIDFREQAGIYVLQDGFRTIYVGQVGRGRQRLFSRLSAHRRNFLAERWDRFSWFGIYPVLGDTLGATELSAKVNTGINDILDHLEGALIAITEPPLNRKGSSFGKAKQYIQATDTSTGGMQSGDDEEE